MAPFIKHRSHPEAKPQGKKGVFARFHRHHPKKTTLDGQSTSPPSLSSTGNNAEFHDTPSIHSSTSLVKGSFSENDVQCEKSKAECENTIEQPPSLCISALHTKEKHGVEGLVMESHSDFYSDPENVRMLQEGGILFSFTCPDPCNEFEEKVVDSVANLSSFEDESRENCVERFVPGDDYTVVLSRCSYLLPGVDINKMCDPEFLASVDYHKACQPTGTTVWEPDENNKTTCRITKPLLHHLFHLTVQFKVSKIKQEAIDTLSMLLGTAVDCGLLLERTKRNAKRKDPTRMGKSVLLYTKVEGGILVNRITVVLQSSVPFIISMAMNKFGSLGLGEAVETVQKTRQYTRETIPMQDSS